MSHHNQQPRRRPWLALGPGTIVALVAAVAIVAYGRVPTRQPRPTDAGRVAYEADSSGHMRRVQAPLAVPASVQSRLWKPSPGFLIDHASNIHLGAAQSRRIGALEAAWQRDRARIEGAMSAESAAIHSEVGPGSASLATLRSGLRDYSELSREYDASRDAHWVSAIALLTPSQRAALDRIEAAPGVKGGESR